MRRSGFYTCLGTAAVTLSIFIFTAACHKTTASEDTGYANDHSVSEKGYEDAQTLSDQAAVAPNGTFAARTSGSACARITHTVTAAGDSVITINFPDAGCVCHDGAYRSGEIIITYTGNYNAVGAIHSHSITFNNFFQDGNQITGTKTVTNEGNNSLGQPYATVTINGSVIRANGAGTVSAVWSRTRTWTHQGSPNVFQVFGTGTITRANGTKVAVNISQSAPLVISSDCRWIEAGTVVYTLPGGLTRSLNYGNTPVCDAEAMLTLPNGKTYNINL